MGRVWRLAGGLIVAVALLSGAGARASTASAVLPDRSLASVRLVDMDGDVWSHDAFRGRVTLVEFWATWCAPCLNELPVLRKLRAQYGRQDFEVLGVSFDVTDRRAFVSWTNRHAVDWPQVFDGRGRHGDAARQLRVVAVPTSYLVDRLGRVVAMNLRGARLEGAVATLVSAPPAGDPGAVAAAAVSGYAPRSSK